MLSDLKASTISPARGPHGLLIDTALKFRGKTAKTAAGKTVETAAGKAVWTACKSNLSAAFPALPYDATEISQNPIRRMSSLV